ncbi:conserved protein of unknown function [Streptantibioticus cattleyicolor NRRL 8057 = DSM 46488]|nr:hypothetical protein [Streptomyces sp. SID5468]CCB72773.1 conserved protein of unknown function [Streptantibioticus cattleyicolor NRRL 8057 = DSM 46488]
MVDYQATRTIDARPERVFAEASDPRTLDHWLPRGVHVESARLPEVTVSHGEPAERDRALMRTEDDRLRVEWGTRDSSEYAGWLQVAAGAAGSSEVTVHLTFRDPGHAPPGGQVEAALGQSLDRLADQVRQHGERPR